MDILSSYRELESLISVSGGFINERPYTSLFTELALDTSENATHLIALYEKWGYTQVATHDWRPGVNYLSVVMSKRLEN